MRPSEGAKIERERQHARRVKARCSVPGGVRYPGRCSQTRRLPYALKSPSARKATARSDPSLRI